MLPNHPPLLVAEAFGTLESFHPGRIDLGLGRGIGSNPAALAALRRDPHTTDRFDKDLEELIGYFASPQSRQSFIAVPGAGIHLPIWLLGSSERTARSAANFGLPLAFSSHLNPRPTESALALYRETFRSSDHFSKPSILLTLSVIIGEDDEHAHQLATSLEQYAAALNKGLPIPFPPPKPVKNVSLKNINTTPALYHTVIGSQDTVKQKIFDFIDYYHPDEMMFAIPIYNSNSRAYTMQALANIFGE